MGTHMTHIHEAELEREAARWVRLLRDEHSASDEVRRDFARWVMQSEHHVRHFLLETAFDESLQALRPRREGTREQWIAELRAMAQQNTRRPPRWVPFALAAGIAIVAVGAAFRMFWPGSESPGEWRQYTAAAATERVTLDDGSVLNMNAGAVIQVRFTPGLREVRFDSGRADFAVTQDAKRLFLVRVPKGSVTVTGTRFDIQVRAAEAEVEVTEGRVRVAGLNQRESVEVSEGERTRVTSAGIVESARYIFRRQTLAAVAAKFNERKRVPKLVVQGTACQRRISAAFNLDDPNELLRDLDANQSLSVKPNADKNVVVIRERSDTSKAAAENQSDCV